MPLIQPAMGSVFLGPLGFGRRSFSYLTLRAVAHSPWKLKRVFGRIAEDAGNPSGARHFTISTALGNEHCEENQHKYDEARS
jgi:hypothetical protein